MTGVTGQRSFQRDPFFSTNADEHARPFRSRKPDAKTEYHAGKVAFP